MSAFLEQGLLIFDRLAEHLALINGLSMTFSVIYRLDDKVKLSNITSFMILVPLFQIHSLFFDTQCTRKSSS